MMGKTRLGQRGRLFKNLEHLQVLLGNISRLSEQIASIEYRSEEIIADSPGVLLWTTLFYRGCHD